MDKGHYIPQSWCTTSPRPIPVSSPRPVQFPSRVHSEWQKLRTHMASPQDRWDSYRFDLPRGLSRPHTPPSLRSSPSPSQCSYSGDDDDDDDDHHYQPHEDLEIEEIEDDDVDGDSGVELLVGEFEEPPLNYGRRSRETYYSDDDSDDEAQREIVHSFGMLSANRGSSPIAWGMAHQQQVRRAKRSYTESVGSDSDYDSGLDSLNSERRTRRRVGRQRGGSAEAVSVGTSYTGSQTSDFEVDMEL